MKNIIKEQYLNMVKPLWLSQDVSRQPQVDSAERYKKASKLSSMAYFYEVLKEGFVPSERPIVGYFCNMVPEEMLIACGCQPVRLCNEDYGCSCASQDIIPSDTCPMIKAAVGALRSSKFENINLVIVPASCDAKIKLAEVLSAFRDVYFLDLPRDSRYGPNTRIWVEAYSRMFEFLKKRFGLAHGRKKLLETCQLLNARTAIFRDIYELRSMQSTLMSDIDYFVFSSVSFWADPFIFVEKARRLKTELFAQRGLGNGFSKRLLICGSGLIFPNFKVLEIMKSAGLDAAADLFCSAYGRMYDPAQIDEETEDGIVRALSLKYVAASLCPCFIGVEKLFDRILDTVETYKLDGVLYHTLRMCQAFDIQALMVRKILKEKNIPALFIKTDLSAEDTGQLKTRLEAFKEMLK